MKRGILNIRNFFGLVLINSGIFLRDPGYSELVFPHTTVMKRKRGTDLWLLTKGIIRIIAILRCRMHDTRSGSGR